MKKVSLNTIIKKTAGYELKVFDFEFEVDCNSRLSSSEVNTIHASLQETIDNEPNCVFYFSPDVCFRSKEPLVIKDRVGEIKVSIYQDYRCMIVVDDDAFYIYSLTSHHGDLENELTPKECALILDKISKRGLLSFIKTYLKTREDELTQLQALGDGEGRPIRRMASLIKHISSIKQWLFLNT